jgi:hypothetical protein
MFEFVKDPLFQALPLAEESERRRRARERGLIFSAAELAAILKIWGDLIDGTPEHRIDALRLPMRDGGAVEIAPNNITFETKNDAPPSAEALHASMRHIAEHWQSKVVIPVDPTLSHESRLRARAYAEVYGIELDDSNECFLPLALTRAELARLPALRAEIRATHSDAPPARPDEEKRLANDYARRHPFRVPQAA